ncbi:hypothetical protein VP01_538g3 [Puccinia sorghi]|uniref:Uncharacterized protein n=1 Tax=Puccinia sorghi TaxID=27349 RepID=A0A0L6ULY4_9BASI|nr:hypothetical protein VP01_538g3 [Puccinia sorghi]
MKCRSCGHFYIFPEIWYCNPQFWVEIWWRKPPFGIRGLDLRPINVWWVVDPKWVGRVSNPLYNVYLRKAHYKTYTNIYIYTHQKSPMNHIRQVVTVLIPVEYKVRPLNSQNGQSSLFDKKKAPRNSRKPLGPKWQKGLPATWKHLTRNITLGHSNARIPGLPGQIKGIGKKLSCLISFIQFNPEVTMFSSTCYQPARNPTVLISTSLRESILLVMRPFSVKAPNKQTFQAFILQRDPVEYFVCLVSDVAETLFNLDVGAPTSLILSRRTSRQLIFDFIKKELKTHLKHQSSSKSQLYYNSVVYFRSISLFHFVFTRPTVKAICTCCLFFGLVSFFLVSFNYYSLFFILFWFHFLSNKVFSNKSKQPLLSGPFENE